LVVVVDYRAPLVAYHSSPDGSNASSCVVERIQILVLSEETMRRLGFIFAAFCFMFGLGSFFALFVIRMKAESPEFLAWLAMFLGSAWLAGTAIHEARKE